MGDSEIYVNVQLGKPDSQSSSRNDWGRYGAEPDVSYAEVNFKTPSAPRVRTDRDGLNTTYSELNIRSPRIDEEEDPPISSGPGGLSTTEQTGAHRQEPKQKIRNTWYRKICLLCLVTFGFGATVAGLSIHVSQTRQSLITSNRIYRRLWNQNQEMNRTQRQYQQQVHELNSNLESRTLENSRLDLSLRNCLKNVTVLNSDLSQLKQTETELRQQLREINKKYRNIMERKDRVCQYLTSKREQTCPQDWIGNEDGCYFVSTLEKSYDEAKEHCSILDSKPLEINTNEEMDFVSIDLVAESGTYWIEKCRDGNVASSLLYKMYDGSFTCMECGQGYSCNRNHRFICEKLAHLDPDVPEEIRGLCQQPVGPTSIK